MALEPQLDRARARRRGDTAELLDALVVVRRRRQGRAAARAVVEAIAGGDVPGLQAVVALAAARQAADVVVDEEFLAGAELRELLDGPARPAEVDGAGAGVEREVEVVAVARVPLGAAVLVGGVEPDREIVAGADFEGHVGGNEVLAAALHHRLREDVAAVDGPVGADAPGGEAVVPGAAVGQAREVVVDRRLAAGDDVRRLRHRPVGVEREQRRRPRGLRGALFGVAGLLELAAATGERGHDDDGGDAISHARFVAHRA